MPEFGEKKADARLTNISTHDLDHDTDGHCKRCGMSMQEASKAPCTKTSSVEIIEDEPVLVFGSNELGQHGGGAAKFAREVHGAIYGQGFGPQGNTFAI